MEIATFSSVLGHFGTMYMYQLAVAFCFASINIFLFLCPTAYPTPDPDRLQQLSEPITAFVHHSPRIDCIFQEGALSQFYSVEWWKGNTLVYNSTNNATNSPRFTVQELGLVIQNVDGSDASEGYFCRVTVLDPVLNRETTTTGTNTALVVIGKLCVYHSAWFNYHYQLKPVDNPVTMHWVVMSCTLHVCIRLIWLHKEIDTDLSILTWKGQQHSIIDSSSLYSLASTCCHSLLCNITAQCVCHLDLVLLQVMFVMMLVDQASWYYQESIFDRTY